MAAIGYDLTSQAFKRNPFPEFARMRADGALVRFKMPIVGEMWLATTYEASHRILKDSTGFVMESQNAGHGARSYIQWWIPKVFRLLADNMLLKDDPEHRRLRNLVDQAFQRRGIAELRPRITEVADRLLDAMASSPSPDFVRDFARDLPLTVICDLLGLPDADHEKFKLWMGRLTTGTSALGILRALPGIYRIIGYLRGQIAEARRNPGPGLISELVRAEADGATLTDDEMLSMVFLLFVAGHETTTHLLSGGLRTLLLNPGEKAKLIADPGLMPLAVEELLRHVSPVQMTKPRYAVADTEIDGTVIKGGEAVLMLIASANYDPDKFETPEMLDISRKPNQHLSFSTGVHFCLGFQLARLEAEIGFARLFERFPEIACAIPDEALPWYGRIGLRGPASLPVKLHA